MAATRPPSKRFRFVNLDGSEPHAFSSVMKWALVDRVMGKRRSGSVAEPAPSVAPDHALLSRPPAVGEPARLTWIGHASWLIQLDGVSLVIDPILSKSIGPGVNRFVAPAVNVGAGLPAIDAQLITHNHRDHLDAPSVRAVGSPVIAGLGLKSFFAGQKLDCTELDWWGETRVGGVTIRFVPSQHWSRRGLNDSNATLWGGFVIEGSTARLYHSGDTAYFDGFTEIGRRSGPIDAAMLPIGAYDPAWFMSKQHMNPEEATQAFLDLGARTFVAMHWGTFKLTDEPLHEPPQRLEQEWKRRSLTPADCKILPVGGVLDVGRPR
ncbi:MAG TPA: MBL fold metallo-hydrolase [Polyangiaceae bacterium]|nr:MBL fold metallo-hydrolase [Polyangiaceae bacterium]